MIMRESLIGQKFGRLTVLNFSHIKFRKTYYICQCDCGNINTVESGALKSGNTKSCGCYHKEIVSNKIAYNRLDYGIAAFNGLYGSYKQGAKVRNLEFTLTKEEFFKLTQENCYYCGIEPLQIHKATKHSNGIFKYNGIDRINNIIGYTKENSVSCCKYCNVAKGQRSKKEFLDWINRVYKYNEEN